MELIPMQVCLACEGSGTADDESDDYIECEACGGEGMFEIPEPEPVQRDWVPTRELTAAEFEAIGRRLLHVAQRMDEEGRFHPRDQYGGWVEGESIVEHVFLSAGNR